MTMVCYIESDLPQIQGVLSSHSEFNRQKFADVDACMDRCNETLLPPEGQEYTNDWNEIVSNIVLYDY